MIHFTLFNFQIKATHAMVKWIVESLQPYKTINHPSFQEFVQTLQPKFEVPSEKYLRVKVIPEIYHQVQFFLKEILANDMVTYAITTDSWTSAQQESFLSITVHMNTKDTTRKIAVIRTMPVNYSHTAFALKEELAGIIASWGLPRPSVILRDSAANISKALEDMSGVACFLHTLQLVVKHSVFKQKQVAITLVKCSKLVKKLRKPAGNASPYENVNILM